MDHSITGHFCGLLTTQAWWQKINPTALKFWRSVINSTTCRLFSVSCEAVAATWFLRQIVLAVFGSQPD